MKKTLKNLEKSVELTSQEYSNIPLDSECTKSQAMQILSKEIGLVSDEKTKNFNQEMQKKRLELDEKAKEWNRKIEEGKLKNEELKTQIEYSRLEFEKANLEEAKRNAKDEKKFKLLSLGLQAGAIIIPATVSLITLLVYKRLSYANLSLIYRDEGRPTPDFKDSCKAIKSLIK